MAQDYAKDFYKSAAWIKCRNGYMASKHYICERCGGLAEICHHKVYISPQNIHDPSITLNWANLEALCRTCHQHEHYVDGEICAEGLTFDENGQLVKPPRSAEGRAARKTDAATSENPSMRFYIRGGVNPQ